MGGENMIFWSLQYTFSRKALFWVYFGVISKKFEQCWILCFIKQATSVDAVKRLHCSSSLEDLHSVDLVVEAIVESEQVKKSLFADLDKIVKSSAILASNTSSISITRLASATSRPSQVCSICLSIDYRLNAWYLLKTEQLCWNANMFVWSLGWCQGSKNCTTNSLTSFFQSVSHKEAVWDLSVSCVLSF